MDYIECARNVFDTEINALNQTKDVIDSVYEKIVELLIRCDGKIILCGMGKSGHVARKIASTFSSLGTPSFFLHPAEALHGDLGMISHNDVVILISNSGESQEILHMLPSIKFIGARMVAITSSGESTLARECDYVQLIPKVEEACVLNLAPTSSTAAILAYGDALAVTISKYHGFTKENFGLFHPEGALGKKILVRVSDIMARGEAIPVVKSGCVISDAIVEMSRKKLGVVTIINEKGQLMGILTDGDLRRAIEKRADMYKDAIDTIMTKNPKYLVGDILAVQALRNLRENSINNYPIVDAEMHVRGVLTWQHIVKAGVML